MLPYLLLLGAATALQSITIEGNAFWKGDDRFYIRGVDYQPGGLSNITDPLSNKAQCERDVAKFKDLGVNTIRVYSVDPGNDHSDCMKLLKDNEMYLILDVNNPESAINRAEPECLYNAFYMKNVFDVVEEFSQYDNTLGFFAGNEVINDEKTTNTAKYVKAVVRDMKQYIKAQGLRKVPVGYSAADIKANRKEQLDYFTCGDDESAKIDFWGHNDYSWCGKSDMQTLGYTDLMEDFKDAAVPIFFSEFGCNSQKDRPFTEIEAIYLDKMSSVLSGGLVYEYLQEANNYGLVEISDDGSSVTELGLYLNLKSEYAKTSNPKGDGNYKKEVKYPSCPSSSDWKSDSDLPKTPEGVKDMIENGAGKIVGLGKMGTTFFLCDAKYNYATGKSDANAPVFNDEDSDAGDLNLDAYQFGGTTSGSNSTNTTSASNSNASTTSASYNSTSTTGPFYNSTSTTSGTYSGTNTSASHYSTTTSASYNSTNTTGFTYISTSVALVNISSRTIIPQPSTLLDVFSESTTDSLSSTSTKKKAHLTNGEQKDAKSHSVSEGAANSMVVPLAGLAWALLNLL